ncbi:MAG TPA: ATPase domain-containing protein [Pyrinomonadaceae bacterium]|nr:ATPase domain-containing protein [Pyrinomonadaceae bacterium]
MSERGKVEIKRLPSGVPRLDVVLGAGVPEYSFNLVAGDPGSGKTTLAHQFMFANATEEHPAIYFTILGEPALKMLRYQQQFSFFDHNKVNKSIHFINLSQEALDQDLGHVLEHIVAQVEKIKPGIVIVDSFRTLVRATSEVKPEGMSLTEFVQRLAIHLTSWQVTSFLIGEYVEHEMQKNPVFTLADGIIVLTQNTERNSMVRQLQVPKMRGQSPQPGRHTVRINHDGLQIYPRMIKPIEEAQTDLPSRTISTGVTGLDEMLGGGTLTGNSILIAGASGSGKTTLAIQFIAEGVKHGEPGVIAIFEETIPKYLDQAKGFGIDLEEMMKQGDLEMVYIRPLDLSVDETLYTIQEAVERIGATRVVLDSISGLQAALAPTFEQDFRESLYRLLGAMTGVGITVLMTVEVTENYNELRFTPHVISFLTHDIVLQRYVEIEGQLRKMMTVIKTRGRKHSSDLRAYEVTQEGIVVGEVLRSYRGLITSVPQLQEAKYVDRDGLTDQETMVLRTLEEMVEAPLKDLAERTGLRRTKLTPALNRLVSLNYAGKIKNDNQTLYRAARKEGAS